MRGDVFEAFAGYLLVYPVHEVLSMVMDRRIFGMQIDHVYSTIQQNNPKPPTASNTKTTPKKAANNSNWFYGQLPFQIRLFCYTICVLPF
jgi:hypothetical protein